MHYSIFVIHDLKPLVSFKSSNSSHGNKNHRTKGTRGNNPYFVEEYLALGKPIKVNLIGFKPYSSLSLSIGIAFEPCHVCTHRSRTQCWLVKFLVIQSFGDLRGLTFMFKCWKMGINAISQFYCSQTHLPWGKDIDGLSFVGVMMLMLTFFWRFSIRE